MILTFQVNYTHVLDFEHLHEDMSAMLPEKQELFAQLKVNAVRLNVNKKHPAMNENTHNSDCVIIRHM